MQENSVHEELEIGVIDNAMLEKMIEEQGPKGEQGRLAREEGIPLDEVLCIRLEFLNILKIDHLWMLSGLTKLNLSNNIIEKIENLDALVELRELDLSFNKIEEISGLNELVNLEILTLYENSIKEIKNLDTLKNLVILSLGNNCIEDIDNVLYFRQFEKLCSLNLAGNPCCEETDIYTYIAAFLPHLTYYEYRMILQEERDAASEKYCKELIKLLESEGDERAIRAKIAADAAEEQLHSESFVEYLGGSALFESLFEKDTEGKLLLLIGTEVEEYYEEYQTGFNKMTRDLFEIGQVMFKQRKAEVAQFFQCVGGAKEESQKKSQEKIDEFLEKKTSVFTQIRRLQAQLDDADPSDEVFMSNYISTIQTFTDDFNDLIQISWKNLMSYELLLFEQVEEVNSVFELTMTDMVNAFIEQAQGFFTLGRQFENTHFEQMMECSCRYLTNSSLAKDFVMPEKLEKIMADKETLINALSASHDMHLLVIDEREDRLVSRANAWLKNLVDNLQSIEVARNRAKVLEINHFLDIQREEFDELSLNILGAAGDNPDLTAALATD